jgi:hypothetical protein
MAPRVARCSNGPTPGWRIFARVIGSSMFLRARFASARAHLCQKAASGARAFARVPRGFERIASPTSTAMRGLPSPRRKAGNGTGPGQDKSGLRPCEIRTTT